MLNQISEKYAIRLHIFASLRDYKIYAILQYRYKQEAVSKVIPTH